MIFGDIRNRKSVAISFVVIKISISKHFKICKFVVRSRNIVTASAGSPYLKSAIPFVAIKISIQLCTSFENP